MDETQMARLARQYSREAVAALVYAIRNSTDLRIKVTAALGLLDRAYGRPGPAKPPSPEYSVEDVDRMIHYLETKFAGVDGVPPAETAAGHPECSGTSPVADDGRGAVGEAPAAIDIAAARDARPVPPSRLVAAHNDRAVSLP